MRSLSSAVSKDSMGGQYSGALFFLCIFCGFFFVTGVSASQDKAKNNHSHSSPANEPIKSYSYVPTGKIDPFKSFIAEQEAIEEKVKKEPKTYLETLDLSQLDLIAIILSPKGNWAMVRDSKGVGYVIRKGTPIGMNGGVVHQIQEKEVIIREKIRDLRKGQVEFRDVAKRLYAPE